MTSFAQQLPTMRAKDTAAIIKATFIYNFSKQVDWPSEYKSGNFVISIMGSSSVHEELVKGYSSKQVGSQQIEIRKLSKTTKISQCHVLYVGRDCFDILPDIAKSLEGTPTLIVADQIGALDKGAAINFVVDGPDFDFELSENNATDRQLFISSTLKSLAIRIK